MRAATRAQRQQSLIAIDTSGHAIFCSPAEMLPRYFRPGDLLVVNDAATLPASLVARTKDGIRLEVRLAQRVALSRWLVVLMGVGDWRQDTDARQAPPDLYIDDSLVLGEDISAKVAAINSESARLVTLQFSLSEPALLAALYRQGRPIQYSYHERNLPLDWLQSPFAARPWSVEMPSAGRALRWQSLVALRRAGVVLASLTHSAGLSATGDRNLDALLPFPEHYEIPQTTVDAINNAKSKAGRVVAVGTTVVRALEGCVSERGALHSGPGRTSLRLDSKHRPALVDGVLSGLHPPHESHFDLLTAFASAAQLNRAWQRAQNTGFQNHELGDAMLLLPGLTRSRSASRHVPTGVPRDSCSHPRVKSWDESDLLFRD